MTHYGIFNSIRIIGNNCRESFAMVLCLKQNKLIFKETVMKIPQYSEMMNPLIEALHILGGSGSVEEINNKIIEMQRYTDDIVNELHGKGPQTEIEYRLGWTRTYLKKYGLLENSNRSVWSIAIDKKNIKKVNSKEVIDYVHDLRLEKEKNENAISDEFLSEESAGIKSWQEKLIELLLSLPPDTFERLIQRILRESGFYQVEVTGRTGDGGIDGKGIFKIAGLISFNVLFQCKRWQKSVTASDIRDFRGAMVGRADKGLFATTGSFTRDAIKEASRDGAAPLI
ncbi:restriction endonuclease [Treponema endosymbiont of Eucomonympha sp.]|uniref:restriction endonuclease n=1 Tax=Treponema endosymbiont of Eucomonympha sp. TaxID=1580831 RepID=UPI001931136E|nr:restriction endonuclease [Treponema endosymbiont of Eucomonympha sp.]